MFFSGKMLISLVYFIYSLLCIIVFMLLLNTYVKYKDQKSAIKTVSFVLLIISIFVCIIGVFQLMVKLI